MRILFGFVGAVVTANGWSLGIAPVTPTNESAYIAGLIAAIVCGAAVGGAAGGSSVVPPIPNATVAAKAAYAVGWALQLLGGLAAVWNLYGLIGSYFHDPMFVDIHAGDQLARFIALAVSLTFAVIGFLTRRWAARSSR